VLAIVVVAFIFDFINGFHDSANYDRDGRLD